ncbi:MAG: FeoA family protein [Bacillota bacterium]
MNLAETKTGDTVRILSIPDPTTRAQIIRFGITEGDVVVCHEVIPGGPVVLRKNRQEIAVGRRLAETISILPN